MNEEIKIYEAYLNGLISYPFQKKDKEDILNYITNLQEESQKLVKIIEEAIKYNKELCELYDCGMELSNAQTNLVILGDEDYKLTELKGGSDDVEN